jgi:hypothetical protein
MFAWLRLRGGLCGLCILLVCLVNCAVQVLQVWSVCTVLICSIPYAVVGAGCQHSVMQRAELVHCRGLLLWLQLVDIICHHVVAEREGTSLCWSL